MPKATNIARPNEIDRYESNCVRLTVNKKHYGYISNEYAEQIKREYEYAYATWEVEYMEIEIEPWFIEGEF
jgi:hypothetical protein